jgi:CubicO group peptidase (beta-lactamase class C family)
MAIGVIAGGRWYASGLGFTSVRDPLPVTEDTLFQTGSTSKAFTGTAIAILASERRIDIEAPVRRYIPSFRLKSEADAAAVTVRHLLTHYGGWVGDYFKDMGRSDDALEQMVAKMADAPQVTPAGFAFSYSNAGFNVLARLVEVCSGAGFEAVMRERVFEPLGMDHTTYHPEEAMVHRFAIGHDPLPGGGYAARRWHIPRSIAGSSGVVSSVVDQLRFAAFHMGSGAQGVLDDAWRLEMQTPQAPAGCVCDHMGLSWELGAVSGHRLVKHGGAINGQLSAFEFVPSHGYACTVLTNSESGREARQVVADACLEHFTGLRKEFPNTRALPDAELAAYAGEYRQRIMDLGVAFRRGALVVHEATPAWLLAIGDRAQDPVPPASLGPIAADRFVVLDGPRRGETAEFLRDTSGAITFMRWDGRLSRRQP